MKDSLFCAIYFRPDGKCYPPPGNGEKVKYSEKNVFRRTGRYPHCFTGKIIVAL